MDCPIKMVIFHSYVSLPEGNLVGGLEHEFYDFPSIGNSNPNWPTHIFQSVETTNQLLITIVMVVVVVIKCYKALN